MIDLRFLGIGGAFCPQLDNTSCFVIKDDIMYLFDCGSSVFGSMVKNHLLDGIKALRVFITHRHADHVGSLATLVSYIKHTCRFPITLVHPESALCTVLESQGVGESQYEFLKTFSYDDKGLSVVFYPVSHSDSLSSFGLEIFDGDESVYYSGDSSQIPQEIWRRFLCGDISRLFQDSSLCVSGKPKGHGDYQEFLAICPEAMRSRFYPVHLNSDYREIIRRDGFGIVSFINDHIVTAAHL